MDYRPRSFRIDDEVYAAIQKLPVSLNQYLRQNLLGHTFTPAIEEKIKANVAPRFRGPLLKPSERK